MRGSEKTISILAAFENGTAAQGDKVRPTLDVLAVAVCADIGNRARLGRPLPLPSTSKARVDELVGAATGMVRR